MLGRILTGIFVIVTIYFLFKKIYTEWKEVNELEFIELKEDEAKNIDLASKRINNLNELHPDLSKKTKQVDRFKK